MALAVHGVRSILVVLCAVYLPFRRKDLVLVLELGSTTTLALPYYELSSLKLASFGLGVYWKKLWKDFVFYSGDIPADCS